MSKNKRVEVRWIDSSFGVNGWHNKNNHVTACMITSVGYVLRSTKQELQLVHSIDDETGVSGMFAIPHVAIKKVKRI